MLVRKFHLDLSLLAHTQNLSLHHWPRYSSALRLHQGDQHRTRGVSGFGVAAVIAGLVADEAFEQGKVLGRIHQEGEEDSVD